MNVMKEPSRRYRSALRERQAAQTRERVVRAAGRLFSVQGYRATTFAQIASEADVSVETVQKHGPKTSLLQAAVELASFGVEGETDVFATEVGQAILQRAHAEEFASLIGAGALAINAPSAGMWMTVVAASRGDDELSAYQAQLLAGIRCQVERVLGLSGTRLAAHRSSFR